MHVLYIKQKHTKMDSNLLLCSCLYVPVNFRIFQARSSIRCELKHTRLYKEGELGDIAGFYTKHQQHVITQ